MATASSHISMTELPPLNIVELTQAQLKGDGVYDKLMESFKLHIEDEYKKGRIKGPEYSQVYLGGAIQVLQTSVDFLVQGRKAALEAALIAEQIELAKVEREKAQVELQILREQAKKVPFEILKLQAETKLIEQNTINAAAEKLLIEANTCKAKGEYDLILAQIEKASQEGALLTAKVQTENAQTRGGASPDSVMGAQISLYGAQKDGFKRDAEQKAAKTMIDSWNVRRSTDEATEANGSNGLYDPNVGRAVQKLLQGIGA